TRVDVINAYPGADGALADAAVGAGARGVVIAGTGAGNGNHALVDWVRQATAGGIIVGLSTRVAEGPAVPIYGNGGEWIGWRPAQFCLADCRCFTAGCCWHC